MKISYVIVMSLALVSCKKSDDIGVKRDRDTVMIKLDDNTKISAQKSDKGSLVIIFRGGNKTAFFYQHNNCESISMDLGLGSKVLKLEDFNGDFLPDVLINSGEEAPHFYKINYQLEEVKDGLGESHLLFDKNELYKQIEQLEAKKTQ